MQQTARGPCGQEARGQQEELKNRLSDIEDQWSQELIEVEQQTSKAGIDKALHNFQRISESGLVIKDVQGFVSSEGGFTLADPGPVFKLGDKLHRLDNLETVRPSVYFVSPDQSRINPDQSLIMQLTMLLCWEGNTYGDCPFVSVDYVGRGGNAR